MDKFKGTKGEWYLQKFTDHYTNIIRCNNSTGFETLFIASTPQNPSPETRANAQLIAAAPELLGLAFKFKSDLLNMLHQSPARDNRIAQIDEVINKALGL